MLFKSIIGATCVCLAVVSLNANAALVSRLGGLAYYDTEANLTWLADTNYAMTSGYDEDGIMNWSDTISWVDDLTIDNVSNWRLPTTLQPDSSCNSQAVEFSGGENCTGSEMGNMYYNVLKNVAGPIQNTGPFNILQYGYWTSTGYNNNSSAFIFFMQDGLQSATLKTNESSVVAWAVHDGDVSAVPIPAAVWLFASGLIGLIGLARRKTNIDRFYTPSCSV